MFHRLLTCSLVAGLIAGAVVSTLHAVLTVPLILQAETYEVSQGQTYRPQLCFGAEAGGGLVLAHLGADHSHAVEAAPGWKPADGWQRTLSTVVATMVSTIGFALMLNAAAFVSGRRLDVLTGLYWGLGGFAATGLATSLGLAPELPGAAAGELIARQAWWISTAAATGLGIWILACKHAPGPRFAGAALIVLPHLIGAPQTHEFASLVPAELASLFTARSVVIQGVLWVVLGLACGWMWQRQRTFRSNTDRRGGRHERAGRSVASPA